MKIGAIVQARFSSARLPGKVLRPIEGKPLLEYLIESLRQAHEIDHFLIATSNDTSDDAVAEFCDGHGIDFVRGSLADVAGRFVKASTEYELDAFVRICGDSPLLDCNLVDYAVRQYKAADVDLVSNVYPRNFPHGQSVEVVRTDSLCQAYPQFTQRADFEHVTPFFYRHPELCRILNMTSDVDHSGHSFAIDTLTDFDRVAALIGAMEGPVWRHSVEDLVRLKESVCAETGTGP